jgi:hypothetical protein
MHSVPLQEWESKSALLQHLEPRGGSIVVVGEAAEAARRFYSGAVRSGAAEFEVGVISSALGSSPQIAELGSGSTLLVGHDAWLTWVNLGKRAITTERRLGGVFFEFLPIGDQEVIVVHELGALRVDADAEEKWRIDTDVVEDYRLDSTGYLVISIMDESDPVTVSISSGAVRR